MANPVADPQIRRAVLRFDATPRLGGGHAIRSLALADRLATAGWDCKIAVSSETLAMLPELRKRGAGLIELDGPAEGEPGELAHALPDGCSILVVDHYERSADFERACRPWASSILVIEDLPNRKHDCNFLLDQTFGRCPRDYDEVVGNGSKMFCGSKFALLRDAFRAARAEALDRRQSTEAVGRILVCMGLSDPGNASGRAIEGIVESGTAAKIDVVLGTGAPNIDEVQRQLSALSGRGKLHVAPNNLAEIMTKADLAISAAGSTTWERCCLGLPAIMTALSDNQALIAKNVSDAGAGLMVGRNGEMDAGQVAEAVAEITRDAALWLEMSEAAAAICDGKGAERVERTL